MKIIMAVFLIALLLFAAGCGTELGHHHEEDHDHDGDGIPDHAPEDHEHEAHHDDEHEESVS